MPVGRLPTKPPGFTPFFRHRGGRRHRWFAVDSQEFKRFFQADTVFVRFESAFPNLGKKYWSLSAYLLERGRSKVSPPLNNEKASDEHTDCFLPEDFAPQAIDRAYRSWAVNDLRPHGYPVAKVRRLVSKTDQAGGCGHWLD